MRGALNGCGDSLTVDVSPARPKQGTIFTVTVRGGPPSAQLRGTVAGEALHFVRDSAGISTSLAAAPIDGESPLGVSVSCTTPVGTDSTRTRVTLSKGAYPLEKLRVAPRFSEPPDSALRARMKREGELAAGVSRAAHETPKLWREPFAPPRTSRITSRYGGGREFNGTVTSRHMGTDYAGATGSPVRAINRGVVRLVESFYLGGNVIYVDHGAGVVSAYLHLSAQTAAVGDTVERGAVVGRVGATGRVTGPHLHLIVRYGSISVDPVSLLDFELLHRADSAKADQAAR